MPNIQTDQDTQKPQDASFSTAAALAEADSTPELSEVEQYTDLLKGYVSTTDELNALNGGRWMMRQSFGVGENDKRELTDAQNAHYDAVIDGDPDKQHGGQLMRTFIIGALGDGAPVAEFSRSVSDFAKEKGGDNPRESDAKTRREIAEYSIEQFNKLMTIVIDRLASVPEFSTLGTTNTAELRKSIAAKLDERLKELGETVGVQEFMQWGNRYDDGEATPVAIEVENHSDEDTIPEEDIPTLMSELARRGTGATSSTVDLEEVVEPGVGVEAFTPEPEIDLPDPNYEEEPMPYGLDERPWAPKNESEPKLVETLTPQETIAFMEERFHDLLGRGDIEGYDPRLIEGLRLELSKYSANFKGMRTEKILSRVDQHLSESLDELLQNSAELADLKVSLGRLESELRRLQEKLQDVYNRGGEEGSYQNFLRTIQELGFHPDGQIDARTGQPIGLLVSNEKYSEDMSRAAEKLRIAQEEADRLVKQVGDNEAARREFIEVFEQNGSTLSGLEQYFDQQDGREGKPYETVRSASSRLSELAEKFKSLAGVINKDMQNEVAVISNNLRALIDSKNNPRLPFDTAIANQIQYYVGQLAEKVGTAKMQAELATSV